MEPRPPLLSGPPGTGMPKPIGGIAPPGARCGIRPPRATPPTNPALALGIAPKFSGVLLKRLLNHPFCPKPPVAPIRAVDPIPKPAICDNALGGGDVVLLVPPDAPPSP